MLSPIANYCLKLSIEVQLEPQLVPNILFLVSVIEIHHSMVSPPEEGGVNESRDVYNKISSSVIQPYITFYHTN